MLSDAYTTLFPSASKLAQYDYVLLSCEGTQLTAEKEAHLAKLKGYADGGGRLFLEDRQSVWIRVGLTPWPATATWIGVGADPPTPITGVVTTNFPKGMALAEWLVNVGASTTRGQLPFLGRAVFRDHARRSADHVVDHKLGDDSGAQLPHARRSHRPWPAVRPRRLQRHARRRRQPPVRHRVTLPHRLHRSCRTRRSGTAVGVPLLDRRTCVTAGPGPVPPPKP